MSHAHECTHCAEWEICPFHPKPEPVGQVNVPAPTILEGAPKFNLHRWVTECPGRIIEDPPYRANVPALAAFMADPFEGHVTGQHATCGCNACKGRRP